jgi:DNA-binding MarR family transcriptional regulator
MEALISGPFKNRRQAEETERLLARTPVIQGACELDLLVFLHRHPRTMLTTEKLAAFVGHDMKRVAKALDTFIAAGLVERIQNPMHAARMYLLVLNGPDGKSLNLLLELASTREGRREILEALNAGGSRTERDATQELRMVRNA